MLSNVFQYDTLQKLDLSQNSLAEVEDLLQVFCIMLFKMKDFIAAFFKSSSGIYQIWRVLFWILQN